ncbi:MAG TPA: hypothetical protein VIL85_18450 [Thermomicrobiales bacterium]
MSGSPSPGSTRRVDVEAASFGVFIGTIISFFINRLPDTTDYKGLLVILTPAITGAIAAGWGWFRLRLVEGSEDDYISTTALEEKKFLLDKLNDDHLTDDEKVRVIAAISEINTLEIEKAVLRIRKAKEIIERRKRNQK